MIAILRKNDDFLGYSTVKLGDLPVDLEDREYLPLTLPIIFVGEYIGAKPAALSIEIALKRAKYTKLESTLPTPPQPTQKGGKQGLVKPHPHLTSFHLPSNLMNLLLSNQDYKNASDILQRSLQLLCADYGNTFHESFFFDLLLELSMDKIPNIPNDFYIQRNQLKLNSNKALEIIFSSSSEMKNNSHHHHNGCSSSYEFREVPALFEENIIILNKNGGSNSSISSSSYCILQFTHRIHSWNFLRILLSLKQLQSLETCTSQQLQQAAFMMKTYFHAQVRPSLVEYVSLNNIKTVRYMRNPVSVELNYGIFIGDEWIPLDQISSVISSTDSRIPEKFNLVISTSSPGSTYLLSWNNNSAVLAPSSNISVDLGVEDYYELTGNSSKDSNIPVAKKLSITDLASGLFLDQPLILQKAADNRKKLFLDAQMNATAGK